MSLRPWLYNTLVNDVNLVPLVGGRVFQGEGMVTAQVIKPFLVFRIGNETSELLAEEDVTPRRVFFQIYVHDTGPDYQIVDSAVEAVKKALLGKKSVPDNLMQTIYLETSRDLDDQTLQTVFRYVRFQAILSQ